jgi:hypothetical protein
MRKLETETNKAIQAGKNTACITYDLLQCQYLSDLAEEGLLKIIYNAKTEYKMDEIGKRVRAKTQLPVEIYYDR